MPKGWTGKSRDNYAASMAQSADHPVSSCIDKIGKNVDDPGAFCASLHDRVSGSTGWRGKGKSEADSGSSNVAQLRPKKESSIGTRTRLREASGSPGDGNRFKVVLIQEGMGNLRDCFFYTKECLKASASLFEGVKCYADHPNEIEEQIQPERSTRDILGHYENVVYVEEAGRGELQAELVLCEGVAFEWAKSLLTNALEYVTKYPNADFVGFSINANGQASSVPVAEFMRSNDLPESVTGKLQQAIDQGIDEIRPVSLLTGDAVSCDLVTEAGAGGKILTMMERNKKPMKPTPAQKKALDEKHRKNREAAAAKAREAGQDGAGDGDSGAQDDHADAGQDAALFQKMIKQYLPKGGEGVDQEESMGMAKAAHEHFMKQGMEAHEAYEAAGEHMKNAHSIGGLMKPAAATESESEKEAREAAEAEAEEAAEAAAAEAETPPPNPKATPKGAAAAEPKESNAVKSLRAELVKNKAETHKLREGLARMETTSYLDKKLASCGKSPEFIQAFREALGKPSSPAQVEETWAIFVKAAEAIGAENSDSGEIFTEKNAGVREAGGKVISFEDCAES